MYLSTIELDTAFKKLQSSWLATLSAKSVFPVPGGPYNKQPFGGIIPTLICLSVRLSGCLGS